MKALIRKITTSTPLSVPIAAHAMSVSTTARTGVTSMDINFAPSSAPQPRT